ncbi:unnamed protein product [Phytomonas sp. Hart1]|nr:unnamed protein product [Phytomonas sp. Hart1]|eukprot:CCW67557.1 unnamed protein product [Phytomonas sp. isolate Hart1]
MSWDNDALLKCICLVRARMNVDFTTTRAPVASLDPVVCLCAPSPRHPSLPHPKGLTAEEQASESGIRFWEEQCALRGALEIFAGRLLRRQKHQQQGANSWTLLPVAEEGLYIQVPSKMYINTCRKWINTASSKKCANSEESSVENYMDPLRFYAAENPRPEVGTLYGYAFYLAKGTSPGETQAVSAFDLKPEESGLLLCFVSTAPVFNFMRTLTVQFVPVLRTAVGIASARQNDAALLHVLYPLRLLMDPKNLAWGTFPGQSIRISLPLPGVDGTLKPATAPRKSQNLYVFSIQRPFDLHNPFFDLPFSALMWSFSADALRVLQSLLFQERRVVFIGMTPQHAAACAVSAPALIAPLIWVAPLISYLSPEHLFDCRGLDALFAIPDERGGGRGESGGLILGSTPELVPALTMRLRQNAVWIADARTGNVSVISPNPRPPDTTIVLEVLPESDKLKSLMKKCITNGGQLAFRAALETMAAYYVNHRSIHKGGVAGLKSRIQLPAVSVRGIKWDDLSGTSESASNQNSSSNIDTTYSQECDNDSPETTPCVTGNPSKIASGAGGNLSDVNASVYPTFPDIPSTRISEVHVAILEYNSQLFLGNYRKSFKMNLASPLAASRSSRAVSTIYSLEYLISNLNMSSALAKQISQTHHLKQFEHGLMDAELLGLQYVLHGDYICFPAGFTINNFIAHEANAISNRYVSDPRLVALLCLFYDQCKRRSPDLFPELQIFDGVGYCDRIATMNLLHTFGKEDAHSRAKSPQSEFSEPLIEVLAGKTSNDRSAQMESCGVGGFGFRRFFTKATKAVRQTISGASTPQIVPIPFPDFTQTFLRFTDTTKLNGPSAVAFWKRVNMVPPQPGAGVKTSTTSKVDLPIKEGIVYSQEIWAHGVAAQAKETLMELEYSLPDVKIPMMSGMDDLEYQHNGYTSPRSEEASKGGHTDVPDNCCLQLGLDVIHQFDRYHPLLNPEWAETKIGAPLSRAKAKAAVMLAGMLAQMFPASRRVHLHAESLPEQVLPPLSPASPNAATSVNYSVEKPVVSLLSHIPHDTHLAKPISSPAATNIGNIMDYIGDTVNDMHVDKPVDDPPLSLPLASIRGPTLSPCRPTLNLHELGEFTSGVPEGYVARSPMALRSPSSGMPAESVDGRNFLPPVLPSQPQLQRPRDTPQSEARRTDNNLLDKLFM